MDGRRRTLGPRPLARGHPLDTQHAGGIWRTCDRLQLARCTQGAREGDVRVRGGPPVDADRSRAAAEAGLVENVAIEPRVALCKKRHAEEPLIAANRSKSATIRSNVHNHRVTGKSPRAERAKARLHFVGRFSRVFSWDCQCTSATNSRSLSLASYFCYGYNICDGSLGESCFNNTSCRRSILVNSVKSEG